MFMFDYNLSPILLNFGSFQIRYYGLFYVIGFIVAYFMINYLVKNKKLNLKKSETEDLLFYIGLFGVIGARLFYVLVYDFKYYLSNLSEILAIWHGGLSFHGGLIGGVIGIFVFAKLNKKNILDLLDVSSIPFSLALGLGRIGNLINGELYGRVADVSWCINYPGVIGCRHPSQVYEAIYSFMIFFVLWKSRDKKLKKGMVFAAFLLMYSVSRFLTEFFREADAQLGYFFGLTMGQILCIIMFISGIALMNFIGKEKKHKNIKKK
jgi:phosphatidylglycerol---prolipoprotein diacylglyceryl transferase